MRLIEFRMAKIVKRFHPIERNCIQHSYDINMLRKDKILEMIGEIKGLPEQEIEVKLIEWERQAAIKELEWEERKKELLEMKLN